MKKILNFAETLVDEREEFEEDVYFNIYLKILYYFVVMIAFCVLFMVITSINNNEKFKIFKFSMTNSTGLVIVSILLIILFKNNIWIKILSVIGIIVMWYFNCKLFYFCVALFFPFFLIIIYRYGIICNLNNRIKRINEFIDSEENKIKEIGKRIFYWNENPDDEYKITLLKGNLKDKTREVFIKKIKNEYVLTKDENGYNRIKEDIKSIYKNQTLKTFFKRLIIIVSVLSVISKYFFEYLIKEKMNEFVDNIIIKLKSENNNINIIDFIKKNNQNIMEFATFLFIAFLIIHFFYKLLGLIFRFKRERIEQVAECIEILKENSHF